MKVSDLLDELRNNILYDRGVSTGANDKLWSDTTLLRYINEAYRRFARRSYCIWDNITSEVCNVTLVEDQSEYVLHQSVLAVVSAKLSDAVRDIPRTTHLVLNGSTICEPMFDAALIGSLNPGVPQAFTTDETLAEDDDGTFSALSLRVFPTPDADTDGKILKLRTVRLPVDEITSSNEDMIPEIPLDYHLAMLDWAAYLALRIVDNDAGNTARSDKFAASFEAHVKEAWTLVLRKIRQPAQWGIGQRGWSWGV
jgi:hypothetical protein